MNECLKLLEEFLDPRGEFFIKIIEKDYFKVATVGCNNDTYMIRHYEDFCRLCLHIRQQGYVLSNAIHNRLVLGIPNRFTQQYMKEYPYRI